MNLKPHKRSAFWVALALTGLCAGVFLLGVHQVVVGKECKSCLRNEIVVGGKCQACPKGQEKVGNACKAPTKCTGDKVSDGKGGCVSCPKGQVVKDGKCAPCGKGQIVVGNACKPSCDGKAFDSTKTCCFADTTLSLNPDKSCPKMRLSEEQVRQIRKKVAQEALSRRDSTEWRRGRVRPPFKSDADKCNLFVAEVANWWKAKVPNMRGVRNPGPPLARDWADPKIMIPGWIVVTDPMPGDVIAVRYSETRSHVGIVVGKRLTASAAAPEYGDKINVNDWGFRPGDRPTFRRYIGEAQ